MFHVSLEEKRHPGESSVWEKLTDQNAFHKVVATQKAAPWLGILQQYQ